MKIIISHSHTKRQINGPFQICGDKEDLRNLCRCIQEQLDDSAAFYYGWIDIVEKPNILANTPPIGWDD